VLVLGETTHWDPNWLWTSEEYYQRRVDSTLEQVIARLGEEPRRVFSLECLFFLRLFWERHAELHDTIRELVNSKRLRLTGTGITTPDTLLPDTEAILRDYLGGQEWLRARGMNVEPQLAYLPDDFGHSPHLPVLLQALGFSQACVTRIDGMYFVGADWRLKKAFPLPGSSAELLQRELKTLDFRWASPDGSEVLCHWNAFTYFQGDMLAHKGIIRWMGTAFGVPWRTARHIAGRIDGFVRSLDPLRRTPYMFCPIGCDFNDPLGDLVFLLDRYNERSFEKSGVWVLNAGMDDYLDLVSHHRDRLPRLELDPNPYWMGFYASRPQIKHQYNRISRKLELADNLSAMRQAAGRWSCLRQQCIDPALAPGQLRSAWDRMVVCNHHDFITGTSPDRVVEEEQRPWLEQTERHADAALESLACDRFCSALLQQGWGPPPEWHLSGGELEIRTTHFELRLSEAAGGCMVSLRTGPDREELLSGPANDVVAYRDTGGLWRMGHEYRGGSFEPVDRASQRPARISATAKGAFLEVRIDSELEGRRFVRWIWVTRQSPFVRMRLLGAACARRTLTIRFPTTLHGSRLTMDVPGGTVLRPAQKLYRPTFWSARSFVHYVDETTGRGLAALLGGPACVSLTGEGALEWVALRNALKERAFGFIPVLAHPAGGTDDAEHVFEYAIRITPRGDFRANRIPFTARQVLRELPRAPDGLEMELLAKGTLVVDHPEIMVIAMKIASRGEGVIARLQSFAAGPAEVHLHSPVRLIRSAWVCDARERDIAALPVQDGKVRASLERSLTSIRLLFE
jgi:hypothetical protein